MFILTIRRPNSNLWQIGLTIWVTGSCLWLFSIMRNSRQNLFRKGDTSDLRITKQQVLAIQLICQSQNVLQTANWLNYAWFKITMMYEIYPVSASHFADILIDDYFIGNEVHVWRKSNVGLFNLLHGSAPPLSTLIHLLCITSYLAFFAFSTISLERKFQFANYLKCLCDPVGKLYQELSTKPLYLIQIWTTFTTIYKFTPWSTFQRGIVLSHSRIESIYDSFMPEILMWAFFQAIGCRVMHNCLP